VSGLCMRHTASPSSTCHRPRRLKVRLLHGIEPFEFDACVCRAKLPVDGANSLVAMILPALNFLTQILDGANVVRQALPR